MNPNGLTWAKWIAAAGVDLSFSGTTEDQLAAYRNAWLAGEDPSDYRAASTLCECGERKGRHSIHGNRCPGPKPFTFWKDRTFKAVP